MAFLDKLNQIAKNIGDKAGDTIETTKLSAKIKSERNAAAEDFQKIGEHYYNLFVIGGVTVPEVLEFCNSAKAHLDAAAEAQAEIDRIKAENEAEKTAEPAAAPIPASEGNVCPACKKVNGPDTKFCSECGHKLG